MKEIQLENCRILVVEVPKWATWWDTSCTGVQFKDEFNEWLPEEEIDNCDTIWTILGMASEIKHPDLFFEYGITVTMWLEILTSHNITELADKLVLIDYNK